MGRGPVGAGGGARGSTRLGIRRDPLLGEVTGDLEELGTPGAGGREDAAEGAAAGGDDSVRFGGG